MKTVLLAIAAVLILGACDGDTTAPDARTATYAAAADTGVPGVDAQKGGKGQGPPACVVGKPYVDPDGCSPDLLLRTPDLVVTDLRAALAAEDWAAVACNYHPDAFVIDDQGVRIGRTEIVAGAQNLNDIFGGVDPVITNEVGFRNVVKTLFTLDGGWIVIPDGVHTYVIENGLITEQTSHHIIEFTGPPPDAS